MIRRAILDNEYLPTLLSLIGEAKNEISLMAFSFSIGSASGKLSTKSAPYQIASALRDIKSKNGKDFRIRLYLEGVRDTGARNRITGDFLASSGMEVKLGSTHAKGLCIDGKNVLFGSTNLTQQSLTKNSEANLLLKDEKSASSFLLYFNHLWEGGTHGEIDLPPPFMADGAFKDAIVEMIDRAKRKVEFSIYFFNHREIENALIRAHRRKVAVKGLIHQHKSFALPYIWANRSTVNRLKAAGLEELYWGPPDTFSHSKYIVVDGKDIALGTGNWLVEDVTTHPQLYVFLRNINVAKALSCHLRQHTI